MLPDELSAGGRLAGRGFEQFVERIGDTHRAIAGRVFSMLGAAAQPVKLAHDAISGIAYGSTRLIGEMLLAVLGEGAALTIPAEEGGVRTRVVLGALNGIWGDYLEQSGSALAIEMSARVHGSAGPRLAVFLHGLCETEDAWFLYRNRAPTYGARLREALGYTPVYVRYNSGLPLAENGARLSALLDEMVRDSPVAVQEITLLGHSMGGLVARQACLEGSGTEWGRRLRHIVALGTPHRGAPLEQATATAVKVLLRVPETRSLGVALDSRSAGIKDLREPVCGPYATNVDHFFFSAGLAAGTGGRFESVIGDLLVGRLSAWDTISGDKLTFGADRYCHIGSATHFDLLGHPAIGEQLVRWLSGGRSLGLGGGAVAAGEGPVEVHDDPVEVIDEADVVDQADVVDGPQVVEAELDDLGE